MTQFVPALSGGELTILRSQPILVPRHYISVAPRTAVFSGEIESLLADPITLGRYGAVVGSTSGAAADVEEDMSIDFGTTPGARDLGTRRVRWEEADATHVYFTESSVGSLPIQVGSFFTVVNEFKPQLVVPRGVGSSTGGVPYTNAITLFMDYDKPYTDENTVFKPKANITANNLTLFSPNPAGFVDPGQTYRTVSFCASFSFTLTTGGGMSTRLWDVADGTIVFGSTTNFEITVRFPVGFRYVKLIQRDTVGTEGIVRIPIWVHDADNMPLTRFRKNRDNTREWREFEVEFFQQETDETVIPRGSPICGWKTMGIALPAHYRSQSLGWVSEDTTLFRKRDPRNVLKVMGLGGWLDRFRSFPLRVYDPGAAVGNWFAMNDITIDRLVFFILNNMTNATRLGNMFLSGITDKLKALDITGASLWAMQKYMVSGYSGEIGSDSRNTIWTHRHHSYRTVAERAAITPLLGLTAADFMDARQPKITRRTNKPTGQLLGGGSYLTGTENTLLASIAPGETPDDGTDTPEAPYQNLPATDSQTAINWLTGQHLAWLNNDRASVDMPVLYPLDVIEPAWGIPIAVSDSYSDSGLILDGDLFLVKEVNLNQSSPRDREEVGFSTEGVTLGAPGQFKAVPEDPIVPEDSYPPYDYDYIPPPTPDPQSLIPDWTGQMPINGILASATETKFARMISYDPVSGAVTYTGDLVTGLTGTNIWARSDPYNYRRCYLLQTTGLFVCEDVENFTTWTLVASNATLFGDAARRGYKLLMSHMVRGWIMALSGSTGSVVSFDYGETWTQVGINNAAPSWSTSVGRPADGGDVAICGRDANHLYSSVAASNIWESDNYRSVDGGLTWALVTSSPKQNNGGGSRSPQLLEIPYARVDGSANTDDSGLQLFGISCDGTQAAVVFSGDRAASWVGFMMREGTSINASSYSPAHSFCGSSLNIFTHDASYQYFGARNDGNGAVPGILIHTEDAYGTFLPVVNLANGQFANVMVNGWSMNPDVAVGWTRGYRYVMTFDGGLTWLSPNMPTGWADGLGYVEFSLYPFQ